MAEADFDGVPLRLYLKLEQGHVADLVAVSQASIAFANGVREIAYLLDPTLNLRVGLMPQSPGSLWQSTVLAAQEEYKHRQVLYQLAAASILWFIQPPLERVRDNWWGPALDRYLPGATDEEKRQVVRVIGPDVAERQRQDAYSAFGRDERITGVGVTIEKRKPPEDFIVPRSEFSWRAGREPVIATSLDRSTVGPLHVILVSPVLDTGTRRWKFATAQGEFGAAIRDERFLQQVIKGDMSIPLKAGIEMDVQLETKERLINGVWQVVERNVIEVDGLTAPVGDRQMPLFPPKDS